MKRRHQLALLLILLPSLLIGTVLLAPAAVLTPLANLLLAESGIQVVSLQSLRLGWRKSEAAALTLSLPGLETDLHGISITYRPRELLRGRVLALQIERIEMIPQAPAAAGDSSEQSIEELLAPLSALPFSRAEIDELHYRGDPELRASISVNTGPLQVETRLAAPAFGGWYLALTLRAAAASEFTGTVSLAVDAEETLVSDFTLAVQDNTLALDAETTLHLAPLLTLPEIAGQLNGLEVLTSTLRVVSSLQLQNVSTEPSLTALTLSLDSPGSSLQARWQAHESVALAQLDLPLQLQGSAGSLLGDLTLTMEELQGSLNVDSGAASLQGSMQAEALRLFCPNLGSCDLEVSTSLAAQRWEAGSISGREASLSGPLSLDFSGPSVQLRSPMATLSLPAIQLSAQQAAAAFEFSGLNVQLTDSPSLQVDVVSTRLEPGLPELRLTNPQLAGQITLNGESLSAGLTLSLNNRLQAGLQLDQSLTDSGPGAGSAALTLQEYVFTDSFNLASLVAYAGLDADLVAGSLGGEATLRWQPGDTGPWQLSGPLTLRLNNLSGAVANSFFVGLDTELNAQIGSGPHLYTEQLLEATLVTLDVGLPLNRINWRYGFDTGAGLYTITDAHTELLGGSVEIAEFHYDINAEQQRVDIALVELDLATIVALANYPDLQVSGTISGYIPLLLDPDGVSVERGLVSALNPGGSIRYTPANPASSNATMQLVNQALSNYQYDHFDAEVSYNESGDAEIAVSLRGMNPELENGRRINVNVNISDNIPTLLRSLQASRAITERLEQRLNRQ